MDCPPGIEGTSRIPQLDGIRGIAILLVLIWHYVSSAIPEGSNFLNLLKSATSLTWSGVDCFFVLSGFLIGGILLDHRGAANYYRVFYVRRFCRIFPLYFTWLALFLVLPLALPRLVTLPAFAPLFENPMPLWSYATFTQNITMALAGGMGPHWLGITWSLAIEEQFYLLLPLLIRIIPIRRLPYLLLTLITSALILRLLLIVEPSFSSLATYVLLPARMDSLLLGVFCAWALRQEGAMQYLRLHMHPLYAAFALLLTAVALLTALPAWTAFLVTSTVGYLLLALFFSMLLLIAVCEKRGPIKWLTMNRPLRNLGVVAYGVYLIHQAVNGSAFALMLGHPPILDGLPALFVTLAGLGATFLLAGMSWHFFEKRVTNWGHQLKYIPSPGPDSPESSGTPANQVSRSHLELSKANSS